MKLDTEKRVEMFLAVREIPYVLGSSGRPDVMMRTNKGNCASKDLKLGLDLIKSGVSKIMIGSVSFDWRNLPIPPSIISNLADTRDIHSCLLVDGEIVDPAWDVGLAKFGLPVLNWDGVHSTGMGVKYSGVVAEYRITQVLTTVYAGAFLEIFRRVASGKKPTPFNDTLNAYWGRF